MRWLSLTALFALATVGPLLWTGCEVPATDAATSGAAATNAAAEVEFSGPPGSGEPYLYTAADGRVFMTWLERGQSRVASLRMAVRSEAGWSEPRTIAESERFFVNWADFPSIVQLRDGTLVVHWLEKTAPDSYAYHVKLTRSSDGGVTWSSPVVPHLDDSPTEHGFVSMVPWGADQAALVWLDARDMALADDGDGGHAVEGAMGLRFRTLASDGAFGEELLVDDRTCECCQTSLARIPDGLVAAYRDRSPEEIRDIHVVRFVDGRWSEPKPVADDGWHIPGCPVNGPQLATRRNAVALTWFTAAERAPRVQIAFSTDGGASFATPMVLGDGTPVGRVDVEWLDARSVVASWLHADGGEAEIRLRRVGLDGELGPVVPVSRTAAARSSGFPRVAVSGGRIFVAWTIPGDDGGIRVGALAADEL